MIIQTIELFFLGLIFSVKQGNSSTYHLEAHVYSSSNDGQIYLIFHDQDEQSFTYTLDIEQLGVVLVQDSISSSTDLADIHEVDMMLVREVGQTVSVGYVKVTHVEREWTCVYTCFHCIFHDDVTEDWPPMPKQFCTDLTEPLYTYTVSVTMGGDGTQESILISLDESHGRAVALLMGPHVADTVYEAVVEMNADPSGGSMDYIEIGSLPLDNTEAMSTFSSITVTASDGSITLYEKTCQPNCGMYSVGYQTYWISSLESSYSLTMEVPDGADIGRLIISLDTKAGRIFNYIMPQIGLPQNQLFTHSFSHHALVDFSVSDLSSTLLTVSMQHSCPCDDLYIAYIILGTEDQNIECMFYGDMKLIASDPQYHVFTSQAHSCIDLNAPVFTYTVELTMGSDDVPSGSVFVKLQESYDSPIAIFTAPFQPNEVYTSSARSNIPHAQEYDELQHIYCAYIGASYNAPAQVKLIKVIKITDPYGSVLVEDLCAGETCSVQLLEEYALPSLTLHWTQIFNTQYFDACVGLPCWYEGTCTDKVDGYECACVEGFMGQYCQIGYSPCVTDVYEESRACYWLEKAGEGSTWSQAMVTCSQKNGTLAVIDSQALLDKLIAENIHDGLTSVWIGGTEQAVTGTYRWTNGKAMDWLPWTPQQPDDETSTEECLVLHADEGGLNDANCDLSFPFICQSIPEGFYCHPSDPACAFWLHQEFETIVESVTCNLAEYNLVIPSTPDNLNCLSICVLSVDFICRMLRVDEIACYGSALTDEELIETDCFADDPTVTLLLRTVDPSYESGSVRYTVHNLDQGAVTWKEAVDSCAVHGYQLLTVKSTAKGTQVGPAESWLALSQQETRGVWIWNDNSHLVFTNWKDGISSRQRTTDCAFHNNDGSWTDELCSDLKPFLCESYTDNPCATVQSPHGVCHNRVDGTFDTECYAGYLGLLCEKGYATAHVSILLDFVYSDFTSEYVQQIIPEWESELNEELSDKIDAFVFVNIPLLREHLLRSMLFVDVVFVVPADWLSTSSLIPTIRNAMRPVIEDGKLGPFVIVPLGDDHTVSISMSPIGGLEPTERTFAVTPVSLLVGKEFIHRYADTHSVESKLIIQPIENELNEIFSSQVDDFHVAMVMFMREEVGQTHVSIDVLTTPADGAFNAGVLFEQVLNGIVMLMEHKTVGGLALVKPLIDSVEIGESKYGLTPSREQFVFMPLGIHLDQKFIIDYTDQLGPESQEIYQEVIAMLDEPLRQSVTLYEFIEAAILTKSEDGRTTARMNVVSLTDSLLFDANELQQSVEAAVTGVIVGGTLGHLPLNPSLSMPFVVLKPKWGEPPVRTEYAFTEASIHLKVDFILEFTDVNSNESKVLARSIEDELRDIFKASVDRFQFPIVVLLRKRSYQTLVDLEFFTLETEESFDATRMKADVYYGLLDALEDGEVGGYELVFSFPISIGEPHLGGKNAFLQKYVFTMASIYLDEKFIRNYTDQRNKDTHILKRTFETQLNPLNDVTGFQYTYVILLRSSDAGLVVVDVAVVSLGTEAKFIPAEIHASVLEALSGALSMGMVGQFQLAASTDQRLTVTTAVYGTPPPTVCHVFTPLMIHLLGTFPFVYTDLLSPAAQALAHDVTTELDPALGINLADYELSTVTLLRQGNGRCSIDLEVVSLSRKHTYVADDVRKAVLMAMSSAVNDRALAGYTVDFTQNEPITIGTLAICKPPSLQAYVYTRLHMRLTEVFEMVHTYSNSSQFLKMKDLLQNKLQTYLAIRVADFQFIELLVIRRQHGLVVLDVDVGCVTFMGTFNVSAEETLWKSVTQAITAGFRDGVLDGWKLDKEHPLPLIVKAPQLGTYLPRQQYAFTHAYIHLDLGWNDTYENINGSKVKQIVKPIEEEVAQVLFEAISENEIGKVVQLRRKSEKVVVDVEIASLVSVQAYNSVSLLRSLVRALKEVEKDGSVGGYALDPQEEFAITLNHPMLGDLVRYNDSNIDSDDNDKGNAAGINWGPDYLKYVIIAGGLVLFGLVVMASILAPKKRKVIPDDEPTSHHGLHRHGTLSEISLTTTKKKDYVPAATEEEVMGELPLPVKKKRKKRRVTII